jgi:hypothetical protein
MASYLHTESKSKPVEGMDFVTLKAASATIRARWEHSRNSCNEDVAALGNGVLKCLNIPFANIPYRWAAPRQQPFEWSGTRDCTLFGPGCPQTSEPLFDVDGIPLFGRLGAASIPIRAEHEDEFACLNLNVFAPARRDDAGIGTPVGGLPVLVWVHGGGYTVGSSSVDLYGKSLVHRAEVGIISDQKSHKTARISSSGLASWEYL